MTSYQLYFIHIQYYISKLCEMCDKSYMGKIKMFFFRSDALKILKNKNIPEKTPFIHKTFHINFNAISKGPTIWRQP